jgi:phage baseplate assembly protein gpV
MAISGSVKVTGGDVIVDGIGAKSHHHTAQGERAPTTSAQK